MAQINMRIILRNDTLANWEANSDVVLLQGEVGVAYNPDGTARIKLGDGVKTWAELDWFGGDTTTITNVTETVIQEMIGTPADAESGAEATGIYKDIEALVTSLGSPANATAGTEATGLYKDFEALQAIVGTPANAETGTQPTGIYKELADAVNSKFNEITDNGKVDTVLELIDYVEQHGESAEQIVHDLTELQALVGTTSVPDQIAAIIADRNILGKAANDEIYEKVKYKISSAPVGTLVSYTDNEIRVMCPAETEYVKQNSGANADSSAYYIGLKAYAPDNAVSFKEDLAEIIADATMYSFDGNDYAGIDSYGRKYSIVWLPVARYNEIDGTWKYYGADSTKSKYIGWYYSVEWYDVDGKMIDSDTIRVNLSNEACHTNPEPYYMGSLIKEIAVNGVLCDVVNNRVDIEVKGNVVSGDEITVNEDGTLSIVKLDASKLITSDTTIVLNGGSAAM